MKRLFAATLARILVLSTALFSTVVFAQSSLAEVIPRTLIAAEYAAERYEKDSAVLSALEQIVDSLKILHGRALNIKSDEELVQIFNSYADELRDIGVNTRSENVLSRVEEIAKDLYLKEMRTDYKPGAAPYAAEIKTMVTVNTRRCSDSAKVTGVEITAVPAFLINSKNRREYNFDKPTANATRLLYPGYYIFILTRNKIIVKSSTYEVDGDDVREISKEFCI